MLKSTGTDPSGRGDVGAVPLTRVMRRDVERVAPDTSLETVTELILRSGAHSLPVVDEAGHVVGIVSKTDVLADHQLHGDTQEVERARLRGRRGISWAEAGLHVHDAVPTVCDVMTRSVLMLPQTATVAEACALMSAHHVHGIPVTAEDGRVVGMVESLDILGWVAGVS